MAVDTGKCKVVSVNAMVAEMVGMFLFIVCGAGTAMSIPHGAGWILHVSLAFGLAITVLAYGFGHHSGAQFNCAVTFGLCLAGKLGAAQGVLNTVGQLIGGTLGAFLLRGIIPEVNDQTFGKEGPGMACNGLGANVTAANAFLGETVGTALLVVVVLETACSKRSAQNGGFAAIAIGLAVMLAHGLLIPVDGCSINPSRTFATAFVAHTNANVKVSPWNNFWVFIFGPLLGATIAVVVFHGLRKLGVSADSAWLKDDDKELVAQDDYEEE